MAERACPCCGHRTLGSPDPGSYEICSVCYWEDDLVQFDDPDYWGGANGLSLREAQRNFKEYGASDRDFITNVRSPIPGEEIDPTWKPLNNS